MHLYYADTIANSLKSSLEPYCDIINIAGSIRRRCPEVKDIELVLIPKKDKLEEKNLFGEVINEVTVIHPEFEKIIRQAGQIIKGKFTGKYMKLEIKQVIDSVEQTINLDIFMPQPTDYARQYAIRTGSANYAHRYIACAWRKKGWVGTDDGLRLMKECYQVAENKWAVKTDIHNPTLPPQWEDEKHFFRWLGQQYLLPEHRNL